MFSKFLKSQKGIIMNKLLAVSLVITLTFANILVLALYAGEGLSAYATGVEELYNQKTEISNPNITFDAYFKIGEEQVYSMDKKIDEEDLVLYAKISVDNGYLKDGVVKFENANFITADTEKSFITVRQLSAGETVEFYTPVKAVKNSDFNLNLLNMNSKIDFSATYVYKDEEGVEVNASRYVNVNWISTEETQLELTQEIITNKEYIIAGENKKVIQIKLNSGISSGEYPIQNTTLKIKTPKFSESFPELVDVMTYGTFETNGNDSTKFTTDNWNYNSENGELTISLDNPADSENIIKWLGAKESVNDTFVLTYVYDENVETQDFQSEVLSEVTLYNNNDENVLSAGNNMLMQVNSIFGDGVVLKMQNLNQAYKGNMYIGENTDYLEAWSVYVTYKEIVDSLLLSNDSDTLTIRNEDGLEGEATDANTFFTLTSIDRLKAISVLGAEGRIVVYDQIDKDVPLAEINLADYLESEEKFIEVKYEEPIRNIQIETTKPINDGILDIVQAKEVSVEGKLEEEILQYSKLNSTINLTALFEGENVAYNNVEGETILTEPETKVNLVSNVTEISNDKEAEFTILATLRTDSAQYKVFKNPIVEIVLPDEFTETTLENVSLAYEEELTIISSEIIVNEEGKKVVKIVLEGEQTKHADEDSVQGGTNIIIELKVNAKKDISTRNVALQLICTNEDEKTSQDISIIKITSAYGIINANSITIGENKILGEVNNSQEHLSLNAIQPETQITFATKFINNYGKEISNVELIGTLPTDKEEMIAEFMEINSSLDGTTYYSEDGENWVTNKEEIINVKYFKVMLANNILDGQEIEMSFNEKTLKRVASSITNLKLKYVFENQNLEKDISFILEDKVLNKYASLLSTNLQSISNTNGIELELNSETEIGYLHEKQIVTYNIRITNNSNINLQNAVLEYYVPAGATITELTYAQGEDIVFTDNTDGIQTWSLNILKGETVNKKVTVRIQDFEGEQIQIVNNACLKDSSGKVLGEVVLNEEARQAKIAVTTSSALNFTTKLFEGSTPKYLAIVENISNEDLHNVVLTFKLPENTKYSDGQYSDVWKYNEEGDCYTYTIEKIKSGEKIIVRYFEIVVTSLGNTTEAIIANSFNAKVENETYKSNIYTNEVTVSNFEIRQTSNCSKILTEGDWIEYTFTIKNTGSRSQNPNFYDNIPKEIQVREVLIYLNEKLVSKDTKGENTFISAQAVPAGGTMKVIIKGVLYNLEEGKKSIEISNYASVFSRGEYIYSEEITNTINAKDFNPDEPDNPDEPEKPSSNSKPSSKSSSSSSKPSSEPIEIKKYSITGFAFFDSNNDGEYTNEDTILTNIGVMLINGNNGEIIEESKTNEFGLYKFNNLDSNKYIVIFKYNSDKYKVTTYKKFGISEDKNSDVFSKKITLNEELQTVAISDIIEINNANIENINIGLSEMAKFDLSLTKKISKVVVNNNAGVKTYEYNNRTDFTKIDIKGKYLDGTVIAIDYEITVTNEGEVAGYVTNIIDYLPKDLKFNSELNLNWYQDSNNYLHNIELSQNAIKPGETKTVILTLTKTLNEKGAGLITNSAEIAGSVSIAGGTEIDSIPGNQDSKEDDLGTASLLISLNTGGIKVLLILAIVICIAGGISIYIIRNKVNLGGNI